MMICKPSCESENKATPFLLLSSPLFCCKIISFLAFAACVRFCECVGRIQNHSICIKPLLVLSRSHDNSATCPFNIIVYELHCPFNIIVYVRCTWSIRQGSMNWTTTQTLLSASASHSILICPYFLQTSIKANALLHHINGYAITTGRMKLCTIVIRVK